jgi:class 3 adenylate cyclase
MDVVMSAIDMRDFIHVHRDEHADVNFEIRIGVNTGPVVAGIVGLRKFAYDIWGDAVNIASRMETSSEPGKINISGSTYELIKSRFYCTYRGRINAKNKGEIDMYYVDGLKQEETIFISSEQIRDKNVV